jgi:hypothetical protein
MKQSGGNENVASRRVGFVYSKNSSRQRAGASNEIMQVTMVRDCANATLNAKAFSGLNCFPSNAQNFPGSLFHWLSSALTSFAMLPSTNSTASCT